MKKMSMMIVALWAIIIVAFADGSASSVLQVGAENGGSAAVSLSSTETADIDLHDGLLFWIKDQNSIEGDKERKTTYPLGKVFDGSFSNPLAGTAIPAKGSFDFSLSFSFKIEELDRLNRLLKILAYRHFYVAEDNVFTISVLNSDSSLSKTIKTSLRIESSNTWYSVAIVQDVERHVRIYGGVTGRELDLVVEYNDTKMLGLDAVNVSLAGIVFGSVDYPSAGYLQSGQFANIRFWTRALTDRECECVDTYAGGATYYVDASGGADSNSGKSASSAKKTIQSAIDVAAAGDVIFVAPGTYKENLNIATCLSLVADGMLNVTIDGGQSGHCIAIAPEASGCVVDGFVLFNGAATNSGNKYGGGILCEADATIINCHFKNNGNSAHTFSGGLHTSGSRKVFVCNCLFTGNAAYASGGASLTDGSGIGGVTTFNRCTIWGNSCSGYSSGSKTFNKVGGIAVANSAVVVVKNSIVWNNSTEQLGSFSGAVGGSITVSYSAVSGGYSGAGNMSKDPKFVDAENGDFSLQASSPCVNAGTMSDIDSDGTRADMGFCIARMACHTITFNANGGVSMPPAITRAHGESYGALPIVERYNCEFMGWFTDAAGGVLITEVDVVDCNRTLYAHWRKFPSPVVFNANGGSPVVSASYQAGLPYGELPLTARNGFRFVGWFTEVVGGDLVAEDSIVDTDRTLYAHWDRYAYDFKWLGGGKLDVCSGMRRTDEAQGIVMDPAWGNGGARAVVSVDGVEKAESRGADEFVWSGDETKEYTLKHQVYDAQGRTVGEPYTAKIAWTSRAVVTFDGGNGDEAFSREYDKSYAYGELPSVTKTGHTFAGWYTAAEGGEKVEAGAQFDGSVSKLYAHWTVNQYGVKFDKNGGEGTAGDLTVAYGDVVPMDGVAFRKSGYRLAGWATAADGAAVYGQNGTMSNLTAEANGSVQLYAVWEPTTVDLKSFRQRYPWNGFVDVECDVGAEGRVGLMLIDEASETNFTAKTLFCQGGSVTNSALWMAEGPQKFIWDAGSDLPDGFKTSKLKAKTYFVEGEE